MATSTFTQLLSSDILPYDYLSPLYGGSVETWLHCAQTTKCHIALHAAVTLSSSSFRRSPKFCFDYIAAVVC